DLDDVVCARLTWIVGRNVVARLDAGAEVFKLSAHRGIRVTKECVVVGAPVQRVRAEDRLVGFVLKGDRSGRGRPDATDLPTLEHPLQDAAKPVTLEIRPEQALSEVAV